MNRDQDILVCSDKNTCVGSVELCHQSVHSFEVINFSSEKLGPNLILDGI